MAQPAISPDDPLISVVMPTYWKDSLPMLREAVQSILGQTHTHLEFLIVMDGPLSEETAAYLQGVAEADSRVQLLPVPENRGSSHGRNLGIRTARGAYIALMDADDISLPHRLARQLTHLHETGAAATGCFYEVINPRGERIAVREVPVDAAAIRKTLFWYNPVPNPAVLARADLLKSHVYPERYPDGSVFWYGEDYALWAAIIVEGHMVVNQPEYLFQYRVNDWFWKRRRGMDAFQTDFRVKWSTMPLYPWYYRPWVALVALATASTRLWPTWTLALLYRVRSRLRYAAGEARLRPGP